MGVEAYSGGRGAYAPSWADRLVGWLDRLPVPFWVPYAALWAFGLLAQTAPKWADGSLALGQFSVVQVVSSALVPYLLVLFRFLTRSADEALQAIRPMLMLSDARYAELEYQLTTSPSVPTLLATLIGASCALVYPKFLEPLYPQLAWATSPLSAALDLTQTVLIWAVVGVVIYASVRQTFTIRRIYGKIEQVNLMLPQPLYGLSGHAMWALAGGTVANYAWLAVVLFATGSATPALIGTTLALQAVITVVYLAPLWGVHQLLVEEKLRLQAQLHDRLERATAELHRLVDQGELAPLDGVQKALASLQIQQNVLDRASTWPWHPETFRIVSTAVAAPLVLWLTQRVLTRLLN